MSQNDTIAAIATAPGAGGVGVVRVSGPRVATIIQAVVSRDLEPRHAQFTAFAGGDGQAIDSGLALYFPGPNSFTGEDVLELQGHGGPVVLNLLLKRLIDLGARIARPGEFSERAFLNGKLDLAQAEAIADLISSGTETAARAAQRSLEGVFSNKINSLLETMVGLRVYVEAAIDFPDEEVDFLADGQVAARVQALIEHSETLLGQAHQGQLLRDGLTLALAGRPNAGKSSLLNALSGRESAIVTAVPGTTRDVLREQIQIDGIPLHVIDTAGLHDSSDIVEQEGIRRARRELELADHVLLIMDQTRPDDALHLELPEGVRGTEVHNKIDLSDEKPRLEQDEGWSRIFLSAKTGEGMSLLREHLKHIAGAESSVEGQFLARTRHLRALEQVLTHLRQGLEQLQQYQAGELLAEELRLAQQHLGEITGEYSSDDLLGAIFSSFCIGK
jgi:tRNA modification GTPase